MEAEKGREGSVPGLTGLSYCLRVLPFTFFSDFCQKITCCVTERFVLQNYRSELDTLQISTCLENSCFQIDVLILCERALQINLFV